MCLRSDLKTNTTHPDLSLQLEGDLLKPTAGGRDEGERIRREVSREAWVCVIRKQDKCRFVFRTQATGMEVYHALLSRGDNAFCKLNLSRPLISHGPPDSANSQHMHYVDKMFFQNIFGGT